MEIRLLDASGIGALDHIAPEVFDNPIDPGFAPRVPVLSDPRHHIAVAIDEGQIVGFASAVHYVHPDKPTELWINEVAVAPGHQRRGVGKAVVLRILALGRELGCVQAWVLTDKTNTAARALYASAGGHDAPGDTLMVDFDLDGP